MMTRGFIILFFAIGFLHSSFSQSSVSLTALNDSISTGYNISILVKINNSSVDSFNLILANYDSLKNRQGPYNLHSIVLADLEISSFGKFKNQKNSFIVDRKPINEDTVKIKIWDEGKFVLIPLINGNKDFLLDENYPIITILKSINPDQKNNTISPINDIIREKKYLNDYLHWYHYLIVLLLMILLGLYWYFNHKKKYKTNVVEVPVEDNKPFSPEQVALAKLLTMKQEKIWLIGKTKEYHQQLTKVLKEYLENKYVFRALEMSSTEVIENLNNIIENKRHIDIIIDILHISDLIKFAKVDIEIDLNEVYLDKSIKLINELM